MKKVLTLSNKQAKLLYDLLLVFEISKRSKNRKRFKFLDVIEDVVFAYEDAIDNINDDLTDKYKDDKIAPKDVKQEIKKLGKKLDKKETKFTFDNIELFDVGKDIFDKSYEVGHRYKNNMGKIVGAPITGRDARVYTEIEDAFSDVESIKEENSLEKKKK